MLKIFRNSFSLYANGRCRQLVWKRSIAHDGPSARGGKRVKGSFDPYKVPYLNPDASVANEMKLAAPVSLFDGPADGDNFVT